jgi:hypothetical protein
MPPLRPGVTATSEEKGETTQSIACCRLLVRIRVRLRKAVSRRKTNPRISSDQLGLLRLESFDQRRELCRGRHYRSRPQRAELTTLLGQESGTIAFLECHF